MVGGHPASVYISAEHTLSVCGHASQKMMSYDFISVFKIIFTSRDVLRDNNSGRVYLPFLCCLTLP